MIRFSWLLISLTIWTLLFTYMPRWPPWLCILLAGITLASYLYQLVMQKFNALILFFSGLIWLGIGTGMKLRLIWEQQSLPLPSGFIYRTILIAALILSAFLTFSNYRLVLSFMQRRGNLDLNKLVKSPRPSIKEQWKAFRKRWRRNQEVELELTLGEEVRQ